MLARKDRAILSAMTSDSKTAIPPIDGGIALVTGASSGIGRELARLLAARSRALVLLARRAQLLEQLRELLLVEHPDLRVETISADLSDEADIDRALDQIHQRVESVDILVNNAGLGHQALFDRADWGRTRQVLLTNVLGMTHLTAALVPGMVSRSRGGILNVGSGAGLTVMPAGAAYCASKHFVDGFSEALRADLAGTGVVVTEVCPGPVESEFDQVAGVSGRIAGGPPGFLRISAAQCARDALAGFDRGQAVVFPGRAYRFGMMLLPLVPRALQRRQAARTAERIRQEPDGRRSGSDRCR